MSIKRPINKSKKETNIEDRYKDIIINSLQFLVQNKRVAVYGFVIMPNHIHIIWQIAEGHKRENVQRDFLKFRAQRIKQDLTVNNKTLLEEGKCKGQNVSDMGAKSIKH